MPRNYKRKAGSRPYITGYTQESLEAAIRKVKSRKLPIKEVAREYNIPYTTLQRKVSAAPIKSHGGQTRLSPETELALVKLITSLTNGRVPLSTLDIRCLVKGYLNKANVIDSRFKDKMPGLDWVRSFMKRHNLTKRVADNVKSSRTLVNSDVINSYFDNLGAELNGIPPENIYNYDETNITDDPGSKTVIVRRGHGHRVERKQDHSKQSTRVMFAGNAFGKYLPPMVVYKALNLYQGWIEGGPLNAVYDVSKNGWFDSRTFEIWYFKVFLPIAQLQPGTKVLIGDNLGSHFSSEVIQSTIESDIKFITLPPNATHICQLLDVAVFRGLKQSWRKILDNWRIESRVHRAIPKENLPTLLARLMLTLKSESLISGFRASGIYPLNRYEVLKRLPDSGKDAGGAAVVEVLNENVLNILKNNLGIGPEKSAPRKPRGHKIPAGKQITSLEKENTPAVPSINDDQAPTSSKKKKVKKAETTTEASTEPDWFCGACNSKWVAQSDDV